MIWFEYLAVTGAAMFGVLLAVLLGGWLVFKAKTITMPTPFLSSAKRDKGLSHICLQRPSSFSKN